MKTLMRNGRDRRSENPGWATRIKSACLCLGPISGSHQGQRPNGRIQRPDTWLHPNASLMVRFLLHRGRRPYMALRDMLHRGGRPSLTEHCGHGWTRSLPHPVANDPRQSQDGSGRKGSARSPAPTATKLRLTGLRLLRWCADQEADLDRRPHDPPSTPPHAAKPIRLMPWRRAAASVSASEPCIEAHVHHDLAGVLVLDRRRLGPAMKASAFRRTTTNGSVSIPSIVASAAAASA
jgi:hypothetical protein